MVRGFVIFCFLKTIDFVHYIYIIRNSISECVSDNLEQIVKVLSGLRHKNLVKSRVVERLNVNGATWACRKVYSLTVSFKLTLLVELTEKL